MGLGSRGVGEERAAWGWLARRKAEGRLEERRAQGKRAGGECGWGWLGIRDEAGRGGGRGEELGMAKEHCVAG